MAHDYYGPDSFSGCDEGGETHKFHLESRVVELPKMTIAQSVWKGINPEYIPKGSKEISKYVCERCDLEQIRVRVLDENTKKYGQFERITVTCHVDNL